jgi:hypothetical protein
MDRRGLTDAQLNQIYDETAAAAANNQPASNVPTPQVTNQNVTQVAQTREEGNRK